MFCVKNVKDTEREHNLPLPLIGSASSQDPTGSWTFSLKTLKFGLYSHTFPSRATSSLHENKFGIGKQLVMKST